MSAHRNLLVVACIALSACTAGSSSSPTASSSAPSPTVASVPSSAVIVLHQTPANLGCDSIGVDYKAMTFHIDPAAAEQVSAMTDTGVSLVTYWEAGMRADASAAPVIRDRLGNVVMADGDVLQVGQRLRGFDVCLTPTKLYVRLPPGN